MRTTYFHGTINALLYSFSLCRDLAKLVQVVGPIRDQAVEVPWIKIMQRIRVKEDHHCKIP